MKTIKFLTGIIIVLFITQNSYAQFSMAGQLSFLKLFGGTGMKSLGVGIKGDYGIDEKTTVSAGINYYFGSKITDYTYGNAFSSTTSPSQIEIPTESKISFIQLYGGLKRYFAGDNESDFGFYGLIEAGLLIAPVKTKVDSYDDVLYYSDVEDGSKETLSNFTINAGLGMEKKFNFGYLFFDTKLNLPANQANGEYVEIQIPLSVSFNLGLRIPLSE